MGNTNGVIQNIDTIKSIINDLENKNISLTLSDNHNSSEIIIENALINIIKEYYEDKLLYLEIKESRLQNIANTL